MQGDRVREAIKGLQHACAVALALLDTEPAQAAEVLKIAARAVLKLLH